MVAFQNVKETIQFPAWQLLPQALPEDVRNACELWMREGQTEELKQAAIDLIPESFKTALEQLGATFPLDLVDVTAESGSVIFHCYLRMNAEPEAPLQKAKFNKTIQAISEVLTADSGSLEPSLCKALYSTMNDPKAWTPSDSPMSVTVSTMKDGKPFYISIMAQGVLRFNQVMNNLVAICEAADAELQLS